MPTQKTLKELLLDLVNQNGSDLHISANAQPRVRIDGLLKPLPSTDLLNPAQARELCLEFASEAEREAIHSRKEIDFAFGVLGVARFRANLYWERGHLAGSFRVLPAKLPKIEALGLPEEVKGIAERPSGLFVVTGATGSGKSTTLASLISSINEMRYEHLITLEDPIEYVFEHGTCMIHQREVGADTASFSEALRYVLRQDPDIIFIGEIRDRETMQMALTAAETGHLVFSTLHTNNAVQTLDRMIDLFDAHQQNQVRSQLSMVLIGILSQQLIPLKNGGRRLAAELLIPNAAIRNLIREGKIHQVYAQMQTGQAKTGMKTMTQSLMGLLAADLIDSKTAREFAYFPEEFDQLSGSLSFKR